MQIKSYIGLHIFCFRSNNELIYKYLIIDVSSGLVKHVYKKNEHSDAYSAELKREKTISNKQK